MMKKFEKWLEEWCDEEMRWEPLFAHEALKETCKMMAHPVVEFANHGEWECSNCRQLMIRPDKYCTHCGAEVIE